MEPPQVSPEGHVLKCTCGKVEKYCQFLFKVSSDQFGDEQKDLCQCLAAVYINFLVSEPDATVVRRPSSSAYCYSHPKEVNRSKEFVCLVVNVLKSLGCENLLVSFVNTLRRKPCHYPVLKTIGPAILDISKTAAIDGSLQVLLSSCISKLEASVCKSIPAPSNYVRPVKFSCACNDCVSLKQFLQHLGERLCQFYMTKNKREHLEQQIHGIIDITHTTEKGSSPHTLVITKTQASYEKKVKNRKIKQSMLASLRPLIIKQSTSEPPTKKQKAGNDTSFVCCSSSSKDASLPVVDLT